MATRKVRNLPVSNTSTVIDRMVGLRDTEATNEVVTFPMAVVAAQIEEINALLPRPGGGAPSDATPAALGIAASGVSTAYSRGDHVHAMPSAAAVGALPVMSPAPTAGKMLVADGSGGLDDAAVSATGAGLDSLYVPADLQVDGSAQVDVDLGVAGSLQVDVDANVDGALTANTLEATTGLTVGGAPVATSASLTSHTGNTSNPHSVTAAQVGADPKLAVQTAHTASTLTLADADHNKHRPLNTADNSIAISIPDTLRAGFVWTGRKSSASNSVTFATGSGLITPTFYGSSTITANGALICVFVESSSVAVVSVTVPA